MRRENEKGTLQFGCIYRDKLARDMAMGSERAVLQVQCQLAKQCDLDLIFSGAISLPLGGIMGTILAVPCVWSNTTVCCHTDLF